ncbi:MAG: hypothetical protein H7Y37_16275 [Anaerolineae bacterium]|nr:hypothetical protein [Gloeobacterales cyanobacterium ES-bin-313]
MLHSQRNAQRGGLAHHLDGLTLEWVLDGMLGKKALQNRIVDKAAVETLLDYLYRHAGMDAGFLHFYLGKEKVSFNSVGDAFAGWLICIEYVHDPKKESYLLLLQPLCKVSRVLRKTCGRLLDYLRDRYPDTYAEKANLLETRLKRALGQLQPEDSGNVDVFDREAVRLDEEEMASHSPSTYIEAKALPAVLGHSRLQIRLQIVPEALNRPTFVHRDAIALGLRVLDRNDIRLSMKEAIGGTLLNQQVRLPLGGEWVELFFDLKGDRNEWVLVEVFQSDGAELVKSLVLPDCFAVSSQSQDPPPVVVAIAENQWQAEIDDPAIREVFMHLQTHGSLTESELIHMLGSPRNARRFTRDFDELVKKVPFSVRIETNSSGKRYVRQDG